MARQQNYLSSVKVDGIFHMLHLPKRTDRVHRWTIRGNCYVSENLYGFWLYIGDTKIRRLRTVDDLKQAIAQVQNETAVN